MEKKYSYKYDDKSGIMFKSYYGLITINDIHSSWDEAINSKIIPDGTKSFVPWKCINFDTIKKHTNTIKIKT